MTLIGSDNRTQKKRSYLTDNLDWLREMDAEKRLADNVDWLRKRSDNVD